MNKKPIIAVIVVLCLALSACAKAAAPQEARYNNDEGNFTTSGVSGEFSTAPEAIADYDSVSKADYSANSAAAPISNTTRNEINNY